MVGSHLNIEARVTPFDFLTGKLIDPISKSYWVGNDNTELSSIPRFVYRFIYCTLVLLVEARIGLSIS